jgi:type IV pilus assembly protein PilQ
MTKAPWDQIFDVVLKNNNLEKQVDGNVVRIATKKTIQAEIKQVEDMKKAQLLASDLETRIRRLNYAKAKVLMTVLKDQMSARGTLVEDERTGSLLISDIPSAVEKIVKLIDMLDTPEPQVEIEARIVSASRDFARDIGIQFGLVQGNLQRVSVGGSNTFATIGGYRPSQTPSNTYIAGNSTTGRGASQSSTSESGAISTGTQASNNAGNYNVNLPSLLPYGGLGLSIGNILDTFLLDAAITAGENRGQAKLISQPKLTTQNNTPGVITQGLRFPIQVVSNNTVTVQFENAALTLTVTPQITADGNVLLDLKVENNSPDFNRQVQGIPSIRTSESSSRVMVADGGTTVIGGIIVEDDSTTEQRVPGLASLPIFGNLFKRSAVSRSSEEVLFFVTPRVIR